MHTGKAVFRCRPLLHCDTGAFFLKATTRESIVFLDNPINVSMTIRKYSRKWLVANRRLLIKTHKKGAPDVNQAQNSI